MPSIDEIRAWCEKARTLLSLGKQSQRKNIAVRSEQIAEMLTEMKAIPVLSAVHAGYFSRYGKLGARIKAVSDQRESGALNAKEYHKAIAPLEREMMLLKEEIRLKLEGYKAKYAPVVESIERNYRHALETCKRLAALDQEGECEDHEKELHDLYAKLTALIHAGSQDGIPALAKKIEARAGHLIKEHEAAVHPAKQLAKKNVEERRQHQEALSTGAEVIKAAPELSAQPGLVAACDKYTALLATGSKNGAANLVALNELSVALAGLPQPLNPSLAKMREAAEAEKTKLLVVRGLIEGAVAGRPPLKFLAGPKTTDMGDQFTTVEQNAALKTMIETEASRSNAFCELLGEVMNCPVEMTLATGRGSCGLFDSYNDGTIDTAHWGILPEAPQTVGGKQVGLTKGEILVHVLEERLYGHQKGKIKVGEPGYDPAYADCHDYDHAHNKCLAPGSFQNLYRRERGQASDTLQLTGGHTKTGASAFQHVSSDGSISTTATEGVNDPGFRADPANFEYDVGDRDGHELVQERFKKTLEQKFRNGPLLDAAGRFDRALVKPEYVKDWIVWLTEQLLNNKKKAEEIVENYIGELGAKYEAMHAADTPRIAGQTTKAQRFLEAKPDAALTPENLNLRMLRRDRASRGPINDAVAQFTQYQQRRGAMTEAERTAEDKILPTTVNAARVNCAVTTMGAIVGANSTGFVQDLFTRNGLVGQKDKLAGLQGDDMWAFVEEGRKDGLALGPNDVDHLREQLNGDAQLRGIRQALLAEAEKRTAAGKPCSVVQDGLNEHGGMYSATELTAHMARYPDGTQFQVFVCGDMNHWVYGEKFDGQIVFEDYQMSSTEGGGKPQTTKLAGDGPPDNPMSGCEGSFGQGMFLAITPGADKRGLPVGKSDPSWPEPGSADDNALTAVIAALAKKEQPAEFATVIEANRATIKPEWCDAAEVVAGIRGAVEAAELLKLPPQLGGDPGRINELLATHKSEVLKITAANKQINMLLRAKVVLKLKFPPVRDKDENLANMPLSTLVLQKVKRVPNSICDTGAIAKAYDDIVLFTTEAKQTPSDANRTKARGAFTRMIAGIDALPATLQTLKSALETAARGLGTSFENDYKQAAAAHAVPDAGTFTAKMDTNAAGMAHALNLDELTIAEEAEVTAGTLTRDAVLGDKRDKLALVKTRHDAANGAVNALAKPPVAANDPAPAETALAALRLAIEALPEPQARTQLKNALYEPLVKELNARRPPVAAARSEEGQKLMDAWRAIAGAALATAVQGGSTAANAHGLANGNNVLNKIGKAYNSGRAATTKVNVRKQIAAMDAELPKVTDNELRALLTSRLRADLETQEAAAA